MKSVAPFLAILFLLFLATSARSGGDEPLFTRLSEKTLEKILEDSDVEFKRLEIEVKGKKRTHYLIAYKSGEKGSLINHGSWLSIWSLGFKTLGNEEIPLERVNTWNQRNSFTSAHVDKDGYGVLTATHDMYGGTNQKIIKNWVKTYGVTLKEFERFTR